METERLFHGLIAYFKYSSIFGLLFTFVCSFFISFDPFHGLESMIMTDLYGSMNMPDEARPVFNFAFLLFCLISILMFVMQYYIVKFALAKKEAWAYNVIVICILLWLTGASVIAVYTHATSYFVSIGMMGLLYVPALVLLKRYF